MLKQSLTNRRTQNQTLHFLALFDFHSILTQLPDSQPAQIKQNHCLFSLFPIYSHVCPKCQTILRTRKRNPCRGTRTYPPPPLLSLQPPSYQTETCIYFSKTYIMRTGKRHSAISIQSGTGYQGNHSTNNSTIRLPNGATMTDGTPVTEAHQLSNRYRHQDSPRQPNNEKTRQKHEQQQQQQLDSLLTTSTRSEMTNSNNHILFPRFLSKPELAQRNTMKQLKHKTGKNARRENKERRKGRTHRSWRQTSSRMRLREGWTSSLDSDKCWYQG
ncbi:hypothetical protein QBC36DRAFT_29163 [Triangularia setosa]|uniref:Uncharacterized protein n=1 Tax=Triangularia setosa TaxID=2587417 RepID=A0AAN6W7R9_9PEZI|nr:hypothetical protein QBC36DRAFT_29163 [Podospora setosa]